MKFDPILLAVLSCFLVSACLFLREAVDEDERYLSFGPVRKAACAFMMAFGIVITVASIWLIVALLFSLA